MSAALVRALRRIVGRDGIVTTREGRLVYRSDMHTYYRGTPDVVVLPRSAGEVLAVVQACLRHGVPIIARGSGTGIIGGAIAPTGGVLVSLNRMDRIVEVDAPNRAALVEAGVINQHLSDRVRSLGLQFAPDPSSQVVSTIGGNIATNAGGPHCLKNGQTANHVLAIQVVTGDGELVWLGRNVPEAPGYDLRGLWAGSEGTFGIIVAAWVKLQRLAPAVGTVLASFSDVEAACRAVSRIIASGVVPAALELMDEPMVTIVEDGIGAGYPRGAGAVLLIEVDGAPEEVHDHTQTVLARCREAGGTDLRIAATAEERVRLWKGRKGIAGAFGRLRKSWLLQDVVVPRSRLPEMARRVSEIARRNGTPIPLVMHAGDGNLHPLVLYDENVAGSLEKAIASSDDLVAAALEFGGSITGEHGVGVDKVEKLGKQFTTADLEFMAGLGRVFDEEERMNPGKMLPTRSGCADVVRLAKERTPRDASGREAWL